VGKASGTAREKFLEVVQNKIGVVGRGVRNPKTEEDWEGKEGNGAELYMKGK